jgi:hypothetical protein
MEFFDKKEEVIDIQLTQYGKYLLSNGKFDPIFYAFYDDDVIYDTKYAASGSGYGEDNTEIQKRILEVPRLKAQYMFTGRDSKVSGSLAKTISNPNPFGFLTDRRQNTEEKHYSLGQSLGTVSTEGDKAPAWEIRVFKGEIKEAIMHHSGVLKTSNIPQLEIEIPWETKILEYDYDSYTSDGGADVEHGSVSKDLTYIDVVENWFLAEVKEINAPYTSDNFDVEVYSIDDINGKEKLTPLFFRKEPEYIQDNILLSAAEAAVPLPEYNTDYINYFLEIWLDEQVDPTAIDFYSENILIDKMPKPIPSRPGINIYDTDPNDEALRDEDDCPDD